MINSEDDQNNKNVNNFAKYSGMAFQMLATIGLFAFIGYKIDENSSHHKLIYTAVLGVLGTLISLFMIVRSLTKKGN